MQGNIFKLQGAFLAALFLASVAAAQEIAPPTTSIVISVPEQKLIVLRDGCFWKKYPISTSKYGVGDSYGSYKTPVGQLRVCEKIGEDLAAGSVIKERHATGEVLPANAPGRDPIVTRILWLDGLEEQNHNARSRGIYIHGTTEESKIGTPASYGCIRMRSKDVEEVFEEAAVDTQVSIIAAKFPHYAKYTPPKPPKIIAVATPKPTPTAVAAAKPAPIADAPPKFVASSKPLSTPAPAAIARVSTAPPPTSTPAFVFSTSKGSALIAAKKQTPAEVAIYHPPALEEAPHGTVTTTAVSNSTIAKAMGGSILSAGLPDGPKAPMLPDPPAPKDVPRFGHLTPTVAVTRNRLSLQDNAVDLAPAILAADAEAEKRDAERRQQQVDGNTDPAGKPQNSVAVRALRGGGSPGQ